MEAIDSKGNNDVKPIYLQNKMSKIHRISQVAEYGWKHSGQISNVFLNGKMRFTLFCDIFRCYRKYGMWSNQYLKERFWELDKQTREKIGIRYSESNLKRETWVKDFYENRKFINKWSKYSIETSAIKREKRNEAYKNRYNMGEGCLVEYGVELSRQHYLPGTIKIGNNVLLAKHVFIDYSGEVNIDDNVKIAAGVSMESHHRDLDAYQQGKDINIPTQLHICEGAYIGTHAIILDSCNYIGKHARIGAGAVVVKDIPDYSVAVGVPAKVVKEIDH